MGKSFDYSPFIQKTASPQRKDRASARETASRPLQSGELLAIHLRIEKFGFAAFLCFRWVPEAVSLACQCGWHRQNHQAHYHLFLKARFYPPQVIRKGQNRAIPRDSIDKKRASGR